MHAGNSLCNNYNDYYCIVLCTNPSPPLHGVLENVPSQATKGSKATFKCIDGYRPSHPVISVCTDDDKWVPDPQEYACIKVTGTSYKCLTVTHFDSDILVFVVLQFLSILPTGTAVLYEEYRRKLIDCPGDVTSYKCEIRSNSEEVHLIWKITLPGVQPIMIQYNSTSNQSVIDDLGMGITSVLTHYITDEYIESLLVIRNNIVNNFGVDEIHMECIIADISTAEKTVFFRTSGIMMMITVTLVIIIQ